jgi:Leucine-rich repeat (LRR) protein
MSTPIIGKVTARLPDFSAGAEPQPLETPKGLAAYGDQRATAIARQFADVPSASAAPTLAQEQSNLVDMLALAAWLMPGPVRKDPTQDAALAQAAGSASQDGAARLGAQAAQHLGIKPTDYTADELAALGEEVVLDNLLAGDMQDFVQTLQPPTRLGVARQLLLDLGLDPERLVDTPQLIDPENLLATNAPRKAADYYFNRDSLSATDLQWMSDRLRSDAELQRMLARLPASLDAEFGKRFDAYADRISAQCVRLLKNSITSLVRQQGIDPAAATVTLSRATLQYYTREVDVHHLTAVQYDKTQAEITGQGYFVSIQTPGAQYRYFVSTHTGQTLALPSAGGPHAWMADHRDTVFDKTQADSALGGRRNEMASRVMMESIGSGALEAMPQWLAPVFRADVQRVREAARGQTPAEVANEALLNSVIPFRRMVTAFDKGDMQGAFHMYLLSMLELMFLAPTGAALTKGLTAVARVGLAPYRTAGIMGLQQMGTQIPGIRESIRLALTTMKTTSQAWRRLRPLDTERLAVALRPVSPKLANELEKIAMQARGATVPDGAWKVPAASDTALATDNAIDTARIIHAQGRDGGELSLLPYGGNGRTYTRYDVSLEQRTGAVLLADRDGWLYSSLPLTTLQRYRVTAPDLLQALAGRRAGGDGAIALGERHYARIGEDYVQVIGDMAVSTAERPIWRAVAPDGMAPDIIAHRLTYDADKALWRQAEMPELKGGGLLSSLRQKFDRASPSPASTITLTPTVVDQENFYDALVAGIRGGATTEQGQAIRALFSRIKADDRGQMILRAMVAHHQWVKETPEIVLRGTSDAALPRPSLNAPILGKTWYLDLAALADSTTEAVVDELAAVYNNLTDILQNRAGSIFTIVPREGRMVFPRGRIPYNADHLANVQLPSEFERAWTRWLSNSRPGERRIREAAIASMRHQLKEQRLYGGIDQPALLALVRKESKKGPFRMRLNFSGHLLDSVPPLPDMLEILYISNNQIKTLDNLPSGLKALEAVKAGLEKLPAELPAGLAYLDVRDNGLASLPALPETLRKLDASNNGLREFPSKCPGALEELSLIGNHITRIPNDLHAGLRKLHLSSNPLKQLPDTWPVGLKELDLSNTGITQFPNNLPAGLRLLRLNNNPLTQLPDIWPPGLEILDLTGTGITEFPKNLPAGLRVLGLDNIPWTWRLDTWPPGLQELSLLNTGITQFPRNLPAGLRILRLENIQELGLSNTITQFPNNFPQGLSLLRLRNIPLMQLPDIWPPDLEILDLTGTHITEFPRNLPAGLRILHLENNQLTQLPDSINSFTNCEIFIDGNPILVANIPAPVAGQAGPRIHFPMPGSGTDFATVSRTVEQAVGYWLQGQPKIPSLGNSIAISDNAAAFCEFLDRLRDTIMYRNETQRALVVKWLKELAERPALRQDSLGLCLGATETCHDRVVSTWNELQRLQLNDDIRIGRYDAHPDQVVQAARQMFRLRVLEEIATRKVEILREARRRVSALYQVDEVEVYLAYAVKLKEKLDLTTVVPQMTYFTLSEVTTEDLAQALATVQAREAAEFDQFLVLDYEPWQTLLKRKDPAAYAAAEDALHELVETRFEQRLEEEIAKLGLDPAHDAAAIADARKDLGRSIMRELQYGQLAPLTRKHQLPAGDVLPVD